MSDGPLLELYSSAFVVLQALSQRRRDGSACAERDAGAGLKPTGVSQ